MNHQGLFWNVHCVANVGLRKRLNLCERGFKIFDLLVFSSFCLRPGADRRSAILKIGVNHATCHVYSLKAVATLINVQCYEYVKYIFLSFYSFLCALDLKGLTNTLKRY